MINTRDAARRRQRCAASYLRVSAQAVSVAGDTMTIQQTSLGDQVYAVIWGQIASHKLRPGDKLSDLHLSQDLGVSRTPVREALHRLAQDGIVRAESRRGFFVTSFSSADVDEIYDIRTALEVLAVRRALPTLTEAEVESARQSLDEVRLRFERGDAEAGERWLKVDREFHQLLAHTAQNRRLSGLLAGLQAQIAVFQVYGTHVRQINLLSLEHHQAILAALETRDGLTAERAMERHIQEVKRLMLAEFASRETNGSLQARSVD
jgi:DNA-binding GntR family transcriptional regulator